jgi:nucleotide-binding universal stress UspA family protein
MEEIKHILCPVDFSAVSEKTAAQAGLLAHQFGCKLTLIHVVSVIPASYGALYGIDFQSVDTMELIRSATEALEEVRTRQIPAGVECHVVAVTGNVSSEIVEEIKKSSVDLVVMATSGAHGVEEFLIGSNAAKIARSSPCAVITLRNPEQMTGFSKVLIPLDIILGLGELLPYLQSFHKLQDFSAEVLLISEPGYKDPDPAITRHFLDKEIQHLAQRGIEKVSWREIQADDLVETICRYAEDNQFGMILMKSEGRSSFAKFILGSNTEGVINHSRVPVLSLRVHDKKEKGRFSGSIEGNS